MRMLESVVLVTLGIAILAQIWPRENRPNPLRYAPLVPTVAAALHLLFEGYRWQMVPAYLLTVWLCLGHFRERDRTQPQRVVRRMVGVVGLLLFGWVAAVVPSALPVFELPAPTGAYAVGTTNLRLTDRTRLETFTADPSDVRSLQVRVWYPAEVAADASRAPYWHDGPTVSRLLARSLSASMPVSLPAGTFRHVGYVPSHAVWDAGVNSAEASYPVLIFSHGYGGLATQNTVQMEQLASQGYIVFSIAHPYEAIAAFYPNGDIVGESAAQLRRFLDESLANEPLFEAAVNSTTLDAKRDAMQALNQASPILLESLAIWVADTRFVMDQLVALNIDHPTLAGSLNLEKIGLFGMSFGGATAVETCLLDSRCKAAVNMDGLQTTSTLGTETFAPPLLFMYSEYNSDINDFVAHRASGPSHSMTILGTEHFDYTDFTLFGSLFERIGFLGPREGNEMEAIVNTYLSSFFEMYLNDNTNQMFESHPEQLRGVLVETHK